MFKTLTNAFKIKDIRNKLIFTFLMLIVIRIGSLLPIPGVNTSYFSEMFSDTDFSFVDAITGGSLTNMSVFALSITPYITSSIIMQLLTIAIPKFEEMQKDGEEGRKKIAEITRYVTVALALIESIAMTIAFKGNGFFTDYSSFSKLHRLFVCFVMVATLTAGSAFLMWIGERITERGVGNGISIVLVINILSRLPEDFGSLYATFIQGENVLNAVIAIIVILAVLIGTIVLVCLLSSGERRIPVQYSRKIQGRKQFGGQSTNIPLKVNTSGVIPVIFAQSILQFPVIVCSFIDIDQTSWWARVLRCLSSQNWFSPEHPKRSVGVILYVAMILFFAYFYTSITFNPMEIATNMKKNGGFIPGIRPGKPTSDYLTKILNKIVFIGAVFLTIVALIPIVAAGLTGAAVSFGGTSIIIVVSVVLETIRQIESQMVTRDYKGFLND